MLAAYVLLQRVGLLMVILGGLGQGTVHIDDETYLLQVPESAGTAATSFEALPHKTPEASMGSEALHAPCSEDDSHGCSDELTFLQLTHRAGAATTSMEQMPFRDLLKQDHDTTVTVQMQAASRLLALVAPDASGAPTDLATQAATRLLALVASNASGAPKNSTSQASSSLAALITSNASSASMNSSQVSPSEASLAALEVASVSKRKGDSFQTPEADSHSLSIPLSSEAQVDSSVAQGNPACVLEPVTAFTGLFLCLIVCLWVCAAAFAGLMDKESPLWDQNFQARLAPRAPTGSSASLGYEYDGKTGPLVSFSPAPSALSESSTTFLRTTKILMVAFIIMGSIVNVEGNPRIFLGQASTFEKALVGFSSVNGASALRALCFCSGLLARTQPRLVSFQALLSKLVVPLLLVSVLLAPINFCLEQGQKQGQHISTATLVQVMSDSVFRGTGISCYLLALIHWRIWGWMLMPLRPLARLVAAIGLSAVGGYVELSTFRMDFAVALLPVYVFGQVIPLERVVAATSTDATGRLAAWLGLVLLWLVERFFIGDEVMKAVPVYGWASLDHSRCAEGLEVQLFWVRGLFLTCWELTKAMLFIFLCMPRGEGRIAERGKHALYAFVLYPVAVSFLSLLQWSIMVVAESGTYRSVRSTETSDLLVSFEVLSFLARAVLSFVLVILLTSTPFQVMFRPILEPKWLRAVEEDQASKGDISWVTF